MRICFPLIVSLLVIPVSTSTGADDKQKGLDQLKGSWKVVKAEPAGPDGRPRFEPKWLIINGDKVTVWFDDTGKKKRETRIKVDPKAKPAHIDLQRGEKKGVSRGIYEVKGDTLRICFSEGLYSIRPTEFKAVSEPEERCVILVTLKREKKQEGK
jgi:uncharacterized protein (TIGR03067 family)